MKSPNQNTVAALDVEQEGYNVPVPNYVSLTLCNGDGLLRFENISENIESRVDHPGYTDMRRAYLDVFVNNSNTIKTWINHRAQGYSSSSQVPQNLTHYQPDCYQD